MKTLSLLLYSLRPEKLRADTVTGTTYWVYCKRQLAKSPPPHAPA
jgi:hypothetical protein